MKSTTVDDVKSQIKYIKEIARTDPEAARSAIDALYRDVLKEVTRFPRDTDSGDRCLDLADLAKECLKANKIELRW